MGCFQKLETMFSDVLWQDKHDWRVNQARQNRVQIAKTDGCIQVTCIAIENVYKKKTAVGWISFQNITLLNIAPPPPL